jgi:hypothetical protein
MILVSGGLGMLGFASTFDVATAVAEHVAWRPDNPARTDSIDAGTC